MVILKVNSYQIKGHEWGYTMIVSHRSHTIGAININNKYQQSRYLLTLGVWMAHLTLPLWQGGCIFQWQTCYSQLINDHNQTIHGTLLCLYSMWLFQTHLYQTSFSSLLLIIWTLCLGLYYSAHLINKSLSTEQWTSMSYPKSSFRTFALLLVAKELNDSQIRVHHLLQRRRTQQVSTYSLQVSDAFFKGRQKRTQGTHVFLLKRLTRRPRSTKQTVTALNLSSFEASLERRVFWCRSRLLSRGSFRKR